MWKEKYCRDTSLLANCYDHLFTWLIRYVSPLVQNKQTSTRSCSVRVILMISCLSVKKSAAYLLKTRDYWCLLVIWYQFIGIEDYMSSSYSPRHCQVWIFFCRLILMHSVSSREFSLILATNIVIKWLIGRARSCAPFDHRC